MVTPDVVHQEPETGEQTRAASEERRNRAIMALAERLLDDPNFQDGATTTALGQALYACELHEPGCVGPGIHKAKEQGFIPAAVWATVSWVGSTLADVGLVASVGSILMAVVGFLAKPIGAAITKIGASKIAATVAPKVAPTLLKVGTSTATGGKHLLAATKWLTPHAERAVWLGWGTQAIGTMMATASMAGLPTPVAAMATAYAAGGLIERVGLWNLKPRTWMQNKARLLLDGKWIRSPWGLWGILLAAGVTIAATLYGTTRNVTGNARTIDLQDANGRHVATVRSTTDADGTEYWERVD